MLASGKKTWYLDDPKSGLGPCLLGFEGWTYEGGERCRSGVWSVEVAKKSNGVVHELAAHLLVDLGDGVACIEFHSKMNTIGSDIVQLISQTLKTGGAGDAFDAFVVTNDATNFSVGANLMLLLMSIQEEEWDDVDLAVRAFQGMTQAIKLLAEAWWWSMRLRRDTWAEAQRFLLRCRLFNPTPSFTMGLVDEVGVGLAPRSWGMQRDAAARRSTALQSIPARR